MRFFNLLTRLRLLAFAVLALAFPGSARAVGWGPTDFLITGAPNFPDRIGVFDQNFAFKGYLDQNFLGVQGMDFDAQGNLVAVSSLVPEVRTYSPAGARIAGFTQADSPMLVSTGDVKVAPDGNYFLGTTANGTRTFTPQGAFIHQYGEGDSRGVALVPGGRLWSGGNSPTVTIFDVGSGAEVGSFTLDRQLNASSMQYGAATNTVLVVDRDRDAGGVFERDLSGRLLQEYHLPVAQTNCSGATWGPSGNVFGTSNNLAIDVVHWLPNGTIVGTLDVYPNSITPVRILWAGAVPEPGATALVVAGASVSCATRPPRRNKRSNV